MVKLAWNRKRNSFFIVIAAGYPKFATDTSETEFRLKVFGAAFFKKGRYSLSALAKIYYLCAKLV